MNDTNHAWTERERLLRSAEKYDETCPHCGEDRLMWKLDRDDGKVKLWSPYRFHVCKPEPKEP